MKFLNYILPLLTLIGLGACSEDLHDMPQAPVVDKGDKISVDVSVNVADMSVASSRAFTDDPVYANLKLYAVEFKLSDSPLDDGSVITNIYTDSISNEGLNEDGDVHFNVTLDKIDEPRVLHLIAVPKDVALTIPYELVLEGNVIPQLLVDNATPAYWQRLEFPTGYGKFTGATGEEWESDKDALDQLQHVPMIRNFAKISLTVTAADFTLDGFAVLNQPTRGYIAPWDVDTNSFPTFLTGKSMRRYMDIDKNYKGRSPGNQVSVTDAAAASYDLAPKYIYERPHSSINFPIVIMQGRRGASGSPVYYKLDLGRSIDNNPFQFYDLLRNFEFAINVTRIDADGYATAQEAFEGVVFNNFSFDVNTRQMSNISNGQDMLQVNQTTFVVTNADDTEITFLYRYRSGINNGNGTVNNNDVELLGLEADPDNSDAAIIAVEQGSDNADGWRSVTIKTSNPTATRKMQEFVVYNPTTGLGRTITVIVRNPWVYTDAGVWGGNYNFYQQFLDDPERKDWEGFVSDSDAIGQPLTVRFHIDDDIPEALFPLEFVFEASPQNIENNKIGNLIVRSGPSLFGTGATTIQYVKTVTWADYNTVLSGDDQTATVVNRDDDGSTSHVVRARFQTIAKINQGSENTIRVYNPYMRVIRTEGGSQVSSQYLDVTFTGKEGTAPDHDLTDPTTPTE